MSVKNKLKNYSALAATLATAASANAEVVYTDIDDVVLNDPNGSFAGIDFNQDGTPEVGAAFFANTSGTAFTLAGMQAFGEDNAIAADPASFFGYTFNSVVANDQNAEIGANITNWQTGGTSSSAQFVLHAEGSAQNIPFEFGQWKGQTDKYVAVRSNLCGSTVYGWVRLDVSNDLTVTIKDFAYETDGSTILAGEMGTPNQQQVTNLAVEDVADANNASDLNVQFNMAADETGLTEYRILALKFEDGECFDAAAAANITNFQTVPLGSNFNGNLNANFLDADGDALEAGLPYNFYVLSKGANTDVLSQVVVSGFFAPGTPATNLLASDIADNGNGSDLQISFDRVADESNVAEYRAYAVPAEFLPLDDETVLQIPEFASFTPNGTNPVVQFNGILDATNSEIEEGIEYGIYIATISSSQGVASAVSEVSNLITLVRSTGYVATNVNAADVSDNYDASDLNVSFRVPNNQTFNDEYRVFAVKAADLPVDDATVLASTNFISVTPAASASYTAEFEATTNDLGGNPIELNTPYVAIVATISNDNQVADAVSLPSNEISLNDENTSIRDLNQIDVSAYVANGLLHVNGKEQFSSVEVLDLNGSKVAQYKGATLQTRLDVSNIGNGVYFAVIENEAGLRSVRKVTVQ